MSHRSRSATSASTAWPVSTFPIDEDHLAPAIALRGWTGSDLLFNDTFAVSRAGTTSNWGIGVVCGTGLNCAGIGPDGAAVRFPALAELSGDFAPGGSWLGVRALGLALRAGDGRGAPTSLRSRVPAHFGEVDAEAVLTGVYSGTIPYGRLFELARVLLDAAADGDAPAREAANALADEVAAFAGAAISRMGVSDAAVEVVLGGGIFETRDAGFHGRVADGIHAVAPASGPPSAHGTPGLGRRPARPRCDRCRRRSQRPPSCRLHERLTAPGIGDPVRGAHATPVPHPPLSPQSASA